MDTIFSNQLQAEHYNNEFLHKPLHNPPAPAVREETVVAALYYRKDDTVKCITSILFMPCRHHLNMPLSCFFIFLKSIAPCQLTNEEGVELFQTWITYATHLFVLVLLMFISLSPHIPKKISSSFNIALSSLNHRSLLFLSSMRFAKAYRSLEGGTLYIGKFTSEDCWYEIFCCYAFTLPNALS
jgi:hypothetical protein